MRKGFAPIAIMILVILVIGIGFAVYTFKSKSIKILPDTSVVQNSTPNPFSSASQTGTLNQKIGQPFQNYDLSLWKVISNTTYNVSFKYPPNYVYIENSVDNAASYRLYKSQEEVDAQRECSQLYRSEHCSEASVDTSITMLLETKGNEDFLQYLQEKHFNDAYNLNRSIDSPGLAPLPKDLQIHDGLNTIDGHKAAVLASASLDGEGYDIYFDLGNKLLIMYVQEKNETIVNQIVSSIKFQNK